MTQLYISPIGLLVQQLNNVGQVLAGGLVNIYVAGSVNTPQATFTDSTGTTQNQNPLVLNSAGRLAANNAPVSIWVPANTPHKMVLTDSTGVLLSGGACLDNLYGIDDPTSVLSVLATPSTSTIPGGADLVANAVKSFDVVASVRSAAAPSLASGQTLVIDVEGGTLVNDGNGGIFYWSVSSTATDDGVTVIKPNSVLTSAAGRYLRQSNLYGTQGSFNLTVTGCTTAPSIAVNYVKNGNQITVSIADTAVLVSNSTGFGFSGWPLALEGLTTATTSPLIPAEDNGVLGISAYLTIPNQSGGGSVVITPNNASALWTASGNKRLVSTSFSYVAH